MTDEQKYNRCEWCGKTLEGPRKTVMSKEMHAACADDFEIEWEAENQRDNERLDQEWATNQQDQE